MHVRPPPSTAHPASGALQSLRSIGHKQSNGIRQTDGAGTTYSTGLEHTAQAPLSSLRRTLMEAACIQLCGPLADACSSCPWILPRLRTGPDCPLPWSCTHSCVAVIHWPVFFISHHFL